MKSIIIDDKLRLEPLRPEMAKEMFDVTLRNREYLEPWMPWARFNTSISTTEDFIKSSLQLETENDGVIFAIIYEEKIAGTIGLHKVNRLNLETSSGYWISKDLQGKGIVTKCLSKVVDLAFEEFGLNRLEIRCSVSNQKSRAIPERLGFRLDGILNEGECVNGEFRDLAVYSVLKKNWKRQKFYKNNFLSAAPIMPSSDLKLTKDYFEKLGIFESTGYGDYLILYHDNFELHFYKDKIEPAKNYSGCYIRVLRIEETYELFAKHGMIHPNGKLELKPWGLKEFTISDPDNNLIRFGERIR